MPVGVRVPSSAFFVMRKILILFLVTIFSYGGKVSLLPKVTLKKILFEKNFHPLGILKARDHKRLKGRKLLDFYTKTAKTHILEQRGFNPICFDFRLPKPIVFVGWEGGRKFFGMKGEAENVGWKFLLSRDLLFTKLNNPKASIEFQRDNSRIIFKTTIKSGTNVFSFRSDCFKDECFYSLNYGYVGKHFFVEAYRKVIYPGWEGLGKPYLFGKYERQFFFQRGLEFGLRKEGAELELRLKEWNKEIFVPEVRFSFTKQIPFGVATVGMRTQRRQEIEPFYYLEWLGKIPWVDIKVKAFFSRRKGFWEEDVQIWPYTDFLELSKEMALYSFALNLNFKAYNLFSGKNRKFTGGVRFNF